MRNSEELGRAEAAQERWMQRLCLGSFSLPEAAEVMDPSVPDMAQIAERSRQGSLLAFEYAGELWCPKYQFVGSEVLAVTPELVTIAREAGATDTDLALWIISPSSLFAEQDAPADHLDAPDKIVAAAHIHFEAIW